MSCVATVNTGMTTANASTRRKMQPPTQPKSLLNLHKREINIGVSPSPSPMKMTVNSSGFSFKLTDASEDTASWPDL